MILAWLIIIPFVGGILAWGISSWSSRGSRWSALIALFIDLVIILEIWLNQFLTQAIPSQSRWILELTRPWIPQFSISHIDVEAAIAVPNRSE